MGKISLQELSWNLFESLPALLGAASLDGRFVKLSDGWETTLGYPIDELEGRDFFQFIHPDDREATATVMADLSDRKSIKFYVNRYRRSNGDYISLEWSSKLGSDGLIYFSAQDVTERERLHRRLKATTNRLEQTADLAGVGGWELSFPDMTVFWDARTRRIHEASEDYEPEITSAIEFYAPEVRESVKAMVQAAMETGEPWDEVLPLITAKGRHIWVRTTGRVIGERGKPERTVGTFQDVTEQVERARDLEAALAETKALRMTEQETRDALKESEARLHSAMDATDMGVWTYRPAEDHFYISAKCSVILGMEGTDGHISGTEYRSYIHEADLQRVLSAAQDHIEGRCDHYRVEVRHRRADGHIVWTESFGRVVERDETGEALLLCGTFQEISRRKAQERMLEESREAADAANEAKSRFLANMSHEIRTPLNGIMGMTQLLQRTELDLRQRRYLTTLQDSGQSLLAIIDDVLDIARIESGRLELEAAPFDLAALLRKAISTVTAQAEEKHLTLTTDFDQALSGWRLGDGKRVLQVLINLAGNAVKFTDAGSVHIAVSPGEEPDKVRFVVADTGPGVSEDQRSRIFDRFAQADDSAGRAHGGAGLGLAISKELVELAGGAMGLEPDTACGAAFWFEWPLPQVNDQDLPAADDFDSPGPASAVCTAPDGRSRLVLVVEDQAVNRALLEEHFAALSCRTLSAGDGAEALAILDEGCAPDAILMDIHMPVLPGDEAIERIRARDDAVSKAPIFALTADAGSQTRERLSAIGADAVFTKPVQLHRITEALLDIFQTHTIKEAPKE